MPESSQPTVFHITHWKAGSQWVRAILKDAVPRRYIRVVEDMSNLRTDLRPGWVYSPVYLPTWGFNEFIPATLPMRRFVVIRDLRDTLVSWYFSVKHSHPLVEKNTTDFLAPWRQRLQSSSIEDGLIMVLEERMDPIAQIQRSWLKAGDLVLRYEDMLADEQGAFQRIFEHCELDVEDSVRRAAVDRHSFESRTGRKRGEEDLSAHHRKGVAGDWQNHFTPRVVEAFKQRFGDVLIETGYEQSTDWQAAAVTR